ncbi:hypothetical protein [Streptomyces profundus]|uniref:hypothetical protein n=1 Tax=Streptomyces profundus TaxID=2867410 RepID=UPI001D1643CE|nr:hypothetical protein [Streptomyces sp. MA3_2.13]UED87105.1 hypothetical protein K4G22_25265 [Streptomyces sp. MA3_2.13]
MRLTERLSKNRADDAPRAESQEAPTAPESPKDLPEGDTGTPQPVAAADQRPGGSAPDHTPDPMVGSGERRAVGPLFTPEEADRLRAEVKGAVAGFVDAPRESVAAADAALEQAVARLTEELANRRRALRDGWQGPVDAPDAGDAAGDTEAQRTALRDYRDLLELLIRI